MQRRDRKADLKRVKDSNGLADWSFAQMNKMADDIRAVLSEHPRRSYMWDFEAVEELIKKGVRPWDYDACCFEGSRCKRQRLMNNVDKIHAETACCQHAHDKNEWAPQRNKTRIQFASESEEEYPAAYCYYVAVHLSVWAARTGRGKKQKESLKRQKERPICRRTCGRAEQGEGEC